MVTFWDTAPSSKLKEPPNHAQKSPVRGPVPPPKVGLQLPSQIGVPKLVEDSVQIPPKKPASKLGSATALSTQKVSSPLYVPPWAAQSAWVVCAQMPPSRQQAPVLKHWTGSATTAQPLPSNTSSWTTPGASNGENMPTGMK